MVVPVANATRKLPLWEMTMIRTSVAAAALALVAAATPSFAGGYETRTPYFGAPSWQYDEPVNKMAVDYSGRYVFDNPRDEHCDRKVVVEEGYWDKHAVRPAPDYYGRYGH
jgi:hypothetical protein